MPSTVQRYPDWKAPAQDGQMLIWPEPARLLADARENHRRLSAAERVRMQGIPLRELRHRQRQWIGHTEDEQLLIATGHQTELHHPGVWVKNALIHAAAAAAGGQAYHFAVDTDEPKHLSVQWPEFSEPITDDPAMRTAAWSGLLAAPSPVHLQQIHEHLEAAQAGWSFTPMLGTYLDTLRRLSLEADRLPRVLVNAGHALDWDLGLRHHALVTSPLWYSEPYLVFVHHLLARAQQFGTQYNAALHDYRQEHGVKSIMRPMPDLHLDSHGLEVPFWLDDLAGGVRTRALLLGPERPWRLVLSSGEAFAFERDAEGWESAERLKRFLLQHQLRLAPRALTLTLFFRLLLVDQFVHGIGGGRYDQVLDRLIAAHFEMEAPRFSVTTATMIFPQAIGQPRACVPCVVQEGHQLKHRLLGDQKSQWLERINAEPRGSLKRRMAFYALHDQLDAALATDPRIARWQERLAATERQAREDQVLFNRELFYAVQPRDRLEEMIARYGNAFA